MDSCLDYLEGSRSGTRYDADVLQRLDPVDGAPLLARYDLTRAGRTLTPRALAERTGPGMWRWSELLPVRDTSHRIHLGEGQTPLLGAFRLGPALGVDRLMVKAEGLNPTGSFKARGMSAAVSRARELGVRSLIAPSAGNAGGALATYGAAAGMPTTVVMPVDTPEVNVVEAQMAGAHVVLVEGVISDCGRVAAAIAERTDAFDVSTLKEPYRVEGKKTMGLELVEQLGWAVPDVIVYPTGGGTGLVGMWKAFEELQALGFLGRGRPRMVSVQAEGCAPIVRALDEGASTATPWEDPQTRASGLRVPSAVGDRLILEALRTSEGTAVAVPEGEIDAVQKLAGRRGVGYVSPESAAAFAAVASLATDGWLAANDRVVVFDTGIGQKYPPPALPRPPVVRPDVVDDDEALALVLPGRAGRAAAARRGDAVRPVAGRPVPGRGGRVSAILAATAPGSPTAQDEAAVEAEAPVVEADGAGRAVASAPRAAVEDDGTSTAAPGDDVADSPASRAASARATRGSVVGDPLRFEARGPRVPGESPSAARPRPDAPMVPGAALSGVSGTAGATPPSSDPAPVTPSRPAVAPGQAAGSPPPAGSMSGAMTAPAPAGTGSSVPGGSAAGAVPEAMMTPDPAGTGSSAGSAAEGSVAGSSAPAGSPPAESATGAGTRRDPLGTAPAAGDGSAAVPQAPVGHDRGADAASGSVPGTAQPGGSPSGSIAAPAATPSDPPPERPGAAPAPASSSDAVPAGGEVGEAPSAPAPATPVKPVTAGWGPPTMSPAPAPWASQPDDAPAPNPADSPSPAPDTAAGVASVDPPSVAPLPVPPWREIVVGPLPGPPRSA